MWSFRERIRKVKVLLLEDNPGDAELLRDMLEEELECSARIQWYTLLSEGKKAIGKEAFDIILMDLGLPDSEGLDTLKVFLSAHRDTAVIVITGLDDGETGRRAVALGAQDYLIKGMITSPLLCRAIRYAMERKRMEKERELLLREVHHRVKNNLSAVGVFLSMQADLLEDAQPEASRILIEAGNRVGLMQSMYQILYQAEGSDFSRVDVKEYARELVSALRTTLLDGTGIELHETIESFPVPVKLASALGIILTELVTNSSKYAFPGDMRGSIIINLSKQDDGAIVLKVGDDGAGTAGSDTGSVGEMPEFKRMDRGGGFGYLLIRTYVEQYSGRIDITRDKGREVTITLPAGRA